MAKRRKSHFKSYALVTVCCLCVAIFLAVFISQRIRLRALNAQLDELTLLKNELIIEEQRLNLLASYMSSEAFANDYARMHLGLIHPNEIILRYVQ